MAALATGVEFNNTTLIDAALRGDIATIQAWFEAGGDVNADLYRLDEGRSVPTRLLNLAASQAEAELVRVLIANGADVNFLEPWYGRKSALQRAIVVPHRDRDPTETAKVLIEAGADLFNNDFNRNIYGVDGCTRLLFDATRHPDILRALLRAGIRVDGRDEAGADVEAILQKEMVAASYFYEDVLALEESARILEGARLAGSYKRYFLAPHHGMLALRALVLRGRAEPFWSTDLPVARLFAGTTAEPDGAAAPSLLPDPLFFLVLTFWLGAY